jgi:hypothetical protein
MCLIFYDLLIYQTFPADAAVREQCHFLWVIWAGKQKNIFHFQAGATAGASVFVFPGLSGLC